VASRDRFPDRRAGGGAERLGSSEQRFGARDRLLDLGVFAQEPSPPTRDLRAGELGQRINASARYPRCDDTVVWPDERMDRERVERPRPSVPLVGQQPAVDVNRAVLGHEHVGDRPIMAAGAAHAGHVPAIDDRALRRMKVAAVQRGCTVGVLSELLACLNLEVGEHPLALPTAAAKRPPPADEVSAVDRHALAATWHRGAGNDRVWAAAKDFLDAGSRQAQRNQLANRVVHQVPANRGVALSHQLADAQEGREVDLPAA
jgi:hypothetical protein